MRTERSAAKLSTAALMKQSLSHKRPPLFYIVQSPTTNIPSSSHSVTSWSPDTARQVHGAAPTVSPVPDNGTHQPLNISSASTWNRTQSTGWTADSDSDTLHCPSGPPSTVRDGPTSSAFKLFNVYKSWNTSPYWTVNSDTLQYSTGPPTTPREHASQLPSLSDSSGVFGFGNRSLRTGWIDTLQYPLLDPSTPQVSASSFDSDAPRFYDHIQRSQPSPQNTISNCYSFYTSDITRGRGEQLELSPTWSPCSWSIVAEPQAVSHGEHSYSQSQSTSESDSESRNLEPSPIKQSLSSHTVTGRSPVSGFYTSVQSPTTNISSSLHSTSTWNPDTAAGQVYGAATIVSPARLETHRTLSFPSSDASSSWNRTRGTGWTADSDTLQYPSDSATVRDRPPSSASSSVPSFWDRRTGQWIAESDTLQYPLDPPTPQVATSCDDSAQFHEPIQRSQPSSPRHDISNRHLFHKSGIQREQRRELSPTSISPCSRSFMPEHGGAFHTKRSYSQWATSDSQHLAVHPPEFQPVQLGIEPKALLPSLSPPTEVPLRAT